MVSLDSPSGQNKLINHTVDFMLSIPPPPFTHLGLFSAKKSGGGGAILTSQKKKGRGGRVILSMKSTVWFISLFCPDGLSSETTDKGSGLGVMVGKVDPVDLDF